MKRKIENSPEKELVRATWTLVCVTVFLTGITAALAYVTFSSNSDLVSATRDLTGETKNLVNISVNLAKTESYLNYLKDREETLQHVALSEDLLSEIKLNKEILQMWLDDPKFQNMKNSSEIPMGDLRITSSQLAQNSISFGSQKIRAELLANAITAGAINSEFETIRHEQGAGNAKFKAEAIDRVISISNAFVNGEVGGVNLNRMIDDIQKYEDEQYTHLNHIDAEFENYTSFNN
ncbi:MAG: hypothetical protein WC861_05595 [Candidatus Micrarchaeia archaeon]|jgi:hypothetical protein